MFELTYGLEKFEPHKTFGEAFIELHKKLTADLEKGISWQMIETTIWILEEGTNFPEMFYEARDRACKIGLLIDGKINLEYKHES